MGDVFVTNAEQALASEHEQNASVDLGMTVAPSTPTRERPTRDTGGRTGDAWRVIVLNDNHNTFEGVAAALAHVLPGVGFDQGMTLANTIHNTGQAVVWSGHREPAELYWESLKDLGLTMAPLER
jgi:ATP-dependent Clp protease adaptor protein ClpS